MGKDICFNECKTIRENAEGKREEGTCNHEYENVNNNRPTTIKTEVYNHNPELINGETGEEEERRGGCAKRFMQENKIGRAS